MDFIKRKIDDLNIPYTVDIVDLSRGLTGFRDKALRDVSYGKLKIRWNPQKGFR